MKTTMTREDTFAKVKSILVDVLAVDEEDVREDVPLGDGGLGAESIDYLDINFRLEKTFGIKIPKGELFPGEDMFNNPEYVENGRMTPVGLAKLKEALPHADFTSFEKDPTLARMADLFTVGTIVRYLESKLATVSANP